MSISSLLEAIWTHVGALTGFTLAFVLIARLMRERRQPSNTVAWLLLIVLVPYVGVPCYIFLGGRKIARLTKKKSPLNIAPESSSPFVVASSPFGVISKGNRTRFQHDGVEAFNDLEKLIAAAKESIEITTFILSHDAVGRRIVKSLSKRARDGVAVRLLIDAVGSFGKKAIYLHDLETAGGIIKRFMPLFPINYLGGANLRNHRKLAIFDRQTAIIGGRNIGREYMGPQPLATRWKDFGVVIDGPAVMQLSAIFEADWAFAHSKKRLPPPTPISLIELPGEKTSTIEIMASGPDTRGDPLYEKILSSIQEASESVTIATPYFIPDEVLQRTLIVKARSGKNVTIIVPRKSNHPVTDLARRHFLRELHEAGASVQLYQPSMMHGKTLVVDGKLAMIGSANIDLRSLFVNYELGAFFYSQSDIDDVTAWIQSIQLKCKPMDDLERAKPNVWRELAEDLSRLVTPLL